MIIEMQPLPLQSFSKAKDYFRNSISTPVNPPVTYI